MARLRCHRCNRTQDFTETPIEGRRRDAFELQDEAHERYGWRFRLKPRQAFCPDCLPQILGARTQPVTPTPPPTERQSEQRRMWK